MNVIPNAQCHYLRITILTNSGSPSLLQKCIVILAKARTSCPLNLMTLTERCSPSGEENR
jgi:hypothetical protein